MFLLIRRHTKLYMPPIFWYWEGAGMKITSSVDFIEMLAANI
jgi:hypothetical protein